MSTWKRGRKWYFRFRFQGRYVMSDRGYESQQEARAAQAEKHVDLARTGAIRMDFINLCKSRLDELGSKRGPSYLSDNLAMVKLLIEEELWALKKTVTPKDVKTFLDRIAAQVSPQRANKYRAYILALFNHDKRYRPSNPVLEIGKYPEIREPKYVPPKEDVAVVLSRCTDEQKDYLWTLALTAARCGEINKLKVEDVKPHLGYLTISTKKAANSQTTYRNIPMRGFLAEIMEHRIGEAKKAGSEYVFFQTHRGSPIRYNYRSKFLRNKCAEAGVRPFTYHCLRHFSTVVMAQKSVPIKEVQLMLGHKRLTTTQIYTESLTTVPANVTNELENELLSSFGVATKSRNRRK